MDVILDRAEFLWKVEEAYDKWLRSKDRPKDAECLDCHFQWRDGGGNTCPNCGSTDIAHVA